MAGSTEAAKKAWATRRREAEQDPEGVAAIRKAAALKAWQTRNEKSKADPKRAHAKRRAAAMRAWTTRRAKAPTVNEDEKVSIRLPVEWLQRLDRLVAALSSDPNMSAAVTVTRLTVVRVALLRGLALLEAELLSSPIKETDMRKNGYLDNIFPLIADAIRRIFKSNGGSWVVHDDVTAALLASAESIALLRDRQQVHGQVHSLPWLAHNAVAWFSQHITTGTSPWAPEFERIKVQGKWAYRPVTA